MCLAVPSKIVDIDNLIATIDVYGARKQVSLMILPEEAKSAILSSFTQDLRSRR